MQHRSECAALELVEQCIQFVWISMGTVTISGIFKACFSFYCCYFPNPESTSIPLTEQSVFFLCIKMNLMTTTWIKVSTNQFLLWLNFAMVVWETADNKNTLKSGLQIIFRLQNHRWIILNVRVLFMQKKLLFFCYHSNLKWFTSGKRIAKLRCD